ncbi:GNAT family N-acetyltransferase [Ramlibacter sp. MMS24-I3-19]|uniref:GNAT family N-acetyltransferase n=1 Tax=Ramlibacter sp. MMS24-I3-19 TaxID=3416606 RepID=UPI003CFCCB1B
MAILQRGRDTVFASAKWEGRIAAVGTACFSHGWCGIHGMRTAPDARGHGLAGAILATFGRMAHQRGLARVFLQVEEGNATARSLYERAGLRTAWCSDYWRRG